MVSHLIPLSAYCDDPGPFAEPRPFYEAGLAAGITEAVTVVTPMEVIKVRLQAQDRNKAQTGHEPKYRNAAHVVHHVVKEEGPAALFKGMSLTALRQGTNVSGPSIPCPECGKEADKK